MHNRLRRLERTSASTGGDGLRPCVACDSGQKKQIIVQMEGNEPFPPLPTCAACGREVAFVIAFRHATPPPRHGAVA